MSSSFRVCDLQPFICAYNIYTIYAAQGRWTRTGKRSVRRLRQQLTISPEAVDPDEDPDEDALTEEQMEALGIDSKEFLPGMEYG